MRLKFELTAGESIVRILTSSSNCPVVGFMHCQTSIRKLHDAAYKKLLDDFKETPTAVMPSDTVVRKRNLDMKYQFMKERLSSKTRLELSVSFSYDDAPG